MKALGFPEKSIRKLLFVSFVFGCLVFLSGQSVAASYGPDLPTHHYPTDKSFHIGYRLLTVRTSNNFVEPLLTDILDDNSRYRLFRHEVTPEYQPNRKLSFGARLRFDSGKLSTADKEISKSALSDQLMFMEFRFNDRPGSSLGLATLVKFPAYKNPTLTELQATTDPSQTVLIGDGQIDLTILLTSERWLSTKWRIQADTGFTFRTDGYNSQIPFMVAAGFVTPKIDFNFEVKGMFSVGGEQSETTETQTIRSAFANSDWSLSPDPWLITLEPNIDLWITSKWALTVNYTYTLMGNRAPAYNQFGAGFIYRWAQTKVQARQTFQEVPITTDQEAGKFGGESEGSPESIYLQEDPIFEDY